MQKEENYTKWKSRSIQRNEEHLYPFMWVNINDKNSVGGNKTYQEEETYC